MMALAADPVQGAEIGFAAGASTLCLKISTPSNVSASIDVDVILLQMH